MRLELLFTIVVIVLLGLVLFSVVSRRRSTPLFRRRASLPPAAFRRDEAPITESPTYHRTKSSIAALRKSLDEAKESMDRVAWALVDRDGSAADLPAALSALRQGLTGAYDSAAVALAEVDEKPDAEQFSCDLVPGTFASVLPGASAEVRTRLIASLREIGAAIEVCGPGIAGFYLALTDQDERFRVVAAAEQLDRILQVLDRALKALHNLERELRT